MPGGLFFSTTVYSKVNSDNTHCFLLNYTTAAFSALTLMTGHQQEHPACKKLNDEVLVWLSDPSAARCRLFAYGSVDATAIPKPPSSPASFKSTLVLPFWYWITQAVLEKRPLNGCSSISSYTRVIKQNTRTVKCKQQLDITCTQY